MKIDQIQENNKLILKLDGELDSIQSTLLEEKISNIDLKVTDLVLDLEKLEYISSAGIRVMLIANRNIKERKGEMKIINVNDSVYEILRLASLIEELNIEKC